MTTDWTTGKIYDRCVYLNCYNGKYSTGHKLFRFPAYTDSRHNIWIRYTGNVRLRTWASATIRRAGICAEHFGRESFVDETRQTLRRYAVPKPYSATDVQTKPSLTLLDQIKSLPRRQMKNRKVTDTEDVQKEFEGQNSQLVCGADETISALEKRIPVEQNIADAVKTLRKVKRIKIEERVSNSNRIIILERCKNPENCPASSQAAQEGVKSRPHFHKVYVNKAGKTRPPTSGIRYTPSNARKSHDSNFVSKQRKVKGNLEEPCEDTANAELRIEETTKVANKPNYRLEKYHINLSKALPEKEESSTTSRYTEDPENQNLLSNWQDIPNMRAVPALARIPEYIHKKYPSTTEFINEYYKTKDERAFDRCAYINCKKGRFTTGTHLFRFPQITDRRLTTWIKNAGNPRMLYWSWSTIRRAGLCGDHFTDDSFFNETRQRLLRSALPKPFYLDKNLSTGNSQDENLSQEDLLKILHVIENGYENGAEELTEPVMIDLPNDHFKNREKLKIRYPFEDPEFTDSDNNTETSNFTGDNVKKESYENFASVMMKTEPINQTEDDQANEILFTTSGLNYTKDEVIEETKDDPLGDASVTNGNDLEDDSEDVNNISEILALQQQKVRLCKIIKQFSAKLKDAKIHKNKLRSQLLAYSDQKMH